MPSMAAVGFLSPATGLFGLSRGHRSHHSRGDSSPARQLLFPPHCSGEAAPEVVANEEGAPPPTSEIPVETSKRSPSLIPTINVQKAIRGIEITDVDHYGRLGIVRGDSYDKEPEDVEPTRLVGYFFLGWFVLSVILSVAIDR